MTLSVAIITLNEESNITECLESVKWADEIVIVDSGSTDKTVQLAKKYTEKIFYHSFANFADQKNQALSRAKGDWIFFIDADERATPELAQEIKRIADDSPAGAVYEIRRQTYFFKKRLHFSGTQNDAPIRFFPKNKIRFDQPVHEHIVTSLPVKRLKSCLVHFSTRDLAHYKKKLTHYVSLELSTMRLKNRKVYFWDPILRPMAKFFFLYFFQLGILDGLTGLQLATLSSYYDWLKLSRYRNLKETA